MVICTQQDLEEMPTGIPQETTSLYLNRNPNIKLNKVNWSAFPALKDLPLSDNNVGDIHHGFFEGLVQLEYLDLSGNNLTLVESKKFIKIIVRILCSSY